METRNSNLSASTRNLEGTGSANNGSEHQRRALVAWLEEQARAAALRTGRPPWPHASMHSFVLAEGKSYASDRLSTQERRIVLGVASKHRLHNGHFLARQCFANAQGGLLHDRSRRLAYVEGFVRDARSSLPFLHGWLSLDGKVVDFTAVRIESTPSADSQSILGELGNRHYFGVEFCREYVENRIAATGGRGTLIDDWEHDFPLLSSNSTAWRRK